MKFILAFSIKKEDSIIGFDDIQSKGNLSNPKNVIVLKGYYYT